MTETRVGLGFDVHPRGRTGTMSLGGVTFDAEPALAGHSDGDVVCHALADALLGATALGDLGEHFPEDDPRFAGIAGRDLLGRVVRLVRDAGWTASACDVTLVAGRPHVAEHRDAIRSALASSLGIDAGSVSFKATRPEGLGLSGDGAGCLAVATVVRAARS